MNSCNKPIGLFDSGIGGLTVAKEIMKLLPNENIVYFGDTARVPYGSKSSEVIMQYTLEAVNFLLSQDVKLIVFACNTVTATCLEKLSSSLSVPIVGVIQPGARAAVDATKNNMVGVIGTERTVQSRAYEKAINALNDKISVHSKACPLFVSLVEEGWLENEAAFYTAKTYLEPLKDQGIDTLVLACTHFPLLKTVIRQVMGESVQLVDPAKETAEEVCRILKEKNLIRQGENAADYRYFVSSNPKKFARVGEGFLKRPIKPLSVIDPQQFKDKV
ncbi:MAG TPA: glutamate racemase [Thermoanaerobacterales bacterium]|nr:glutamate racemase [Thermoanaerobacterales bacterium]